MKKISILGATGSVGLNTLKILAAHKNKYNIIALTAYKNYKKLAKYALMLNCKYAVIGDKKYHKKITKLSDNSGINISLLGQTKKNSRIKYLLNNDEVLFPRKKGWNHGKK